ncbi:MAG: ABC transporter permease [Bacteroidales bacterium]|jgi:ABC-2 type transport system permease protein|nr:ABC transporter permease [Bacteroidales bacterium]
MKNKTLLIISREYLTRIQKKSFIIITILMPILLVAMIVLPIMLVSLSEQRQFSRILVVDESEIFINNFEDNKHYEFSYRSGDIEQIKKEAFDQDFDVVLQILGSTQGVKSNIYYKKNLPTGLQSEVEDQMDDIFFNQLLRDSLHIEPARFENMQNLAKAESTTIQIDEQGGEKEHDAEINQIFGMVCGLVIYFIIIIFASQVLRGVLEEKSNRIVEVLISSVRPTQLLLGKIVGIALVGLTQLVIWIALSGAILGGIQLAAPNLFSEESVETIAETPGVNLPDTATLQEQSGNIFEMIQNYFAVSFGTIILCFIFFFVVGYLIYSTLYAATGSVVDNESDSQQYTMPITIPLILAIVFVPNISMNPDGALAFWLSMIPLTSPIAMMVRLPSGVPAWELLLSMGLALGFLVFSIWFAAKIYRIGILNYGNKPSWKTIFKWLRE